MKSQIGGSSSSAMDIDTAPQNPSTSLEPQAPRVLDDEPTFQNEPTLPHEPDMPACVSNPVKTTHVPTSEPELEIVQEYVAIVGDV